MMAASARHGVYISYPIFVLRVADLLKFEMVIYMILTWLVGFTQKFAFIYSAYQYTIPIKF